MQTGQRVRQLPLHEPLQRGHRRLGRLFGRFKQTQRHPTAGAVFESRKRIHRHAGLIAHVDALGHVAKLPLGLFAQLVLGAGAAPGVGVFARNSGAGLALVRGDGEGDLGQLAARADFPALVIDHAHTHAQVVGQRALFGKHAGVDLQLEPFADQNRERLRQGVALGGETRVLGGGFGQLPRGITERHEIAAQLLGQGAQVMFNLGREVAGHRPVQRGGSEIGGDAHRHIQRHAVVGLAGFVGVVERQRGLLERHRLRVSLGIGLQFFGVAQVVGRKHEKARLGTLALADKVHQLGHRGDARKRGRGRSRSGSAFGNQPRGVEAVNPFVEVEVAAVAGTRQQVFDFLAHAAVVGDEIQRPGDLVVNQCLADKNLRGVHRVHFTIAHRTRIQLQPVEASALLHHHAAGVLIPKWLAVGDLHHVCAEIESPERIHPRGGSGKQPRGFHDLRRHDPARAL